MPLMLPGSGHGVQQALDAPHAVAALPVDEVEAWEEQRHVGARRPHALGVAFISLQEQRLKRLTISRKRLPAATPTAVSRDARPAEGFPNLLLALVHRIITEACSVSSNLP